MSVIPKTCTGWSPSPFMSSRDSKASQLNQRPEDYMDDEVCNNPKLYYNYFVGILKGATHDTNKVYHWKHL